MRVLDVVNGGLEKMYTDLRRLGLPGGTVAGVLTGAGHFQLSKGYEDMLERQRAEAQKF